MFIILDVNMNMSLTDVIHIGPEHREGQIERIIRISHLITGQIDDPIISKIA